MNKPACSRRRGFTLIEMLTVVIIIAILVSLTTAGVMMVYARSQVVQVGVEIAKLSQAITYLSSRLVTTAPPPSDLRFPADSNSDVYKYVRKHWPRYNIAKLQADLTLLIPGYDPNQYQPDKALVFWLSGIGPDTADPFTGAGTKKGGYAFDPELLQNGVYYSSKTKQPGEEFLYFDYRAYSKDYGAFQAYRTHNPEPYIDNNPANGSYDVGENYTDTHPNSAWDLNMPYNPATFQIINAGPDRQLGTGRATAADGLPYTGADADNMTNFTKGNLLGDYTKS